MRIGIDIDDTICSTNENILIEADKYDKEVLGGTGIKDESAFEFTKMMGWPENMKGKFFADRLEHIMKTATLKDGAKDIINKLYNEGHEIYFITYRKDKYISDPYKITKDYLDSYDIKYNKLIANSGEKGIVCHNNNIDLFIDDNVKNIIDVSSYNIETLLFTSMYNKNEKKYKRVNNWNEIYNIVHGGKYGGKSN